MTEPTTKLSVINERAELEAPDAQSQLQLIKQAVASSKLTDAEFRLFVEIARRCGLDPLRRQIHAVKRWTRDEGDKMVIQVGIDGFRAVARRHGLAGIDEPEFDYDPKDSEQKWPKSCRVTVYRWAPNGERESYTARVWLKEVMQTRRDKESGKDIPVAMWARMPHAMISKCAEAAALRKGFSESLTGLYEPSEFADGPVARNPAPRAARKIEDVVAPKQEVEAEVVDDGPPDGEGYYPDDSEAP